MNKRFWKRLAATVAIIIAQTIAEHILRKQFRHHPNKEDSEDKEGN